MKKGGALLLGFGAVLVGGTVLLLAARREPPSETHNIVEGRRYALTWKLPPKIDANQAAAQLSDAPNVESVRVLGPRVIQQIISSGVTGIVGDLQTSAGIFRLLAFDDLGPVGQLAS